MIKSKVLNVEFLKNNYLYIIWCAVCFTATWVFFGMSIGTFFLVLVLYIISLTTAFSPMGEKILRLVNRVRQSETKREKEYLIPIFEDVYAQAKRIYPNLREDTEICITDAIYMNAAAVARGAVDSVSDEELKGFIAHESGHTAHGDTKAVLLTTAGNGLFTIFAIISKMIVNFVDCMLNKRGFAGFTELIFNILLLVFVYIGEVILCQKNKHWKKR